MICSAVVAERIAAAAAPVGVALPHLAGCGQLGPDMRVTHETLAAYCAHPNVGAVLVVALGCEQVVAQMLAEAARAARQAGARSSRSSREGGHRPRDREGERASRSALAERARRARARVVRRRRSSSCRSSAAAPTTRRGWRRTRRSAASPIGSSTSAAARCSARSPRSWAPSTCSRRARPTPAAATQLIQIITPRRGGSAGARPRHPRHAAVARQHPRRPDDDRGEVARRDAQGRRARAARGRRRLRGADHAARG